MFCQKKVAEVATEATDTKSKTEGGGAAEEAEVGWVTEAKDWAGELISGQTTTGRILVSDEQSSQLCCSLYNLTTKVVSAITITTPV